MLFRTVNLSAYATAWLRELGPYAVIALIVPGGFLIAFLVWVFRNRAFVMGRLRSWQLDRIQLDRITGRLDGITAIREAAHSWAARHVFGPPVSAMVFARAGSDARKQRREGHRGAGPCVRL